jgi:hypothetical protein
VHTPHPGAYRRSARPSRGGEWEEGRSDKEDEEEKKGGEQMKKNAAANNP